MLPTLLLLNGRIYTLDDAHPHATALATQLSREPDPVDGPPGLTPVVDDFAGANTLIVVASIDVDLVNAGGDILGVWAATHEVAGN